MASNPRLDAAYAAQVKSVRARVEAFGRSRFLAGEYRDADLKRFTAAVVPVVLAGRKQVSALTDAYLARVLSAELGRTVAPRGPIDTDLLRGVDPAEVYARPFVTVRTKLSEGLPFDAAKSAGLARLTDITLADMQMAKRNTAQAVLSTTEGVHGFRRTLTGSKNCQLCSDASRQRYHSADLLPIHPGCDCGVEPLTEPTGREIPSKVVAVHDHGELGPVLAVKGQHFDGPAVANH